MNEIPEICDVCMAKPCKIGSGMCGLTGSIMVINRSMAVPCGCSLLLNDEYRIRNLLSNLDFWELDRHRIAALESEWNSGNYGEVYYTSGDRICDATEYIVEKWKQKRCTIIGFFPVTQNKGKRVYT